MTRASQAVTAVRWASIQAWGCIFAESLPKSWATILMVTHDAFSASYARRILFLKDGRLFNELYQGDKPRREFYHEILDVLSVLGGDTGDAL